MEVSFCFFFSVLKIRILRWASVGYDKDVGKVVSAGDALGEQVFPKLLPDHQSHFSIFKA